MKKEIANNAEKLIAEGKISEAIDFIKLRTKKNEIIQKELSLLNSRLKNLRKQERLGIISDIDSKVEINRMNYSMLDLIYEFREGSLNLTDESVLIDRAKLIREEEDLNLKIKIFKSDTNSIDEVEEEVKELFFKLPNKIEEYNLNTGLQLIYLQNSRMEYESIINFEGKGSIYIKWHQKFSNSLDEAELIYMLFDRPQKIGQAYPLKQFEPKMLKRLIFFPTVNTKFEIGWMNKDFAFLKLEELFNPLFELILDRLE